jgi:hypothetical protein
MLHWVIVDFRLFPGLHMYSSNPRHAALTPPHLMSVAPERTRLANFHGRAETMGFFNEMSTHRAPIDFNKFTEAKV